MEASSSCQAQSYFMHANPTFVYETVDNFHPGSGYPPQRPVLEHASPYRAGRDTYTAGQTPKPARPPIPFTGINYQAQPCHNGHSAYYDPPISPQTDFYDSVDKPHSFYPTPTPSPVLRPVIHSAAYTTHHESTHAAGPSLYDAHLQYAAGHLLVERAEKRLSASRAAPYSPTHARHPIAAGYPYEPPTHRRQSAYEAVVPSRVPVRVTGTAHKTKWAELAPGQVHVIIHNAARVKFTPNATVRDFQELKIRAEAVLYAPRSLDYLSVPNDRDSVSFSVDGMPAPHIEQLVRSKVRVRVDGGDQEAFINSGWRQTKVRFVWEEFSSDVEGVNVKRPDESKITRDELAVLVATHIWQVIRDVKTKKRPYHKYEPAPGMEAWDLRSLDIRVLRLVGVVYFKPAWVAVLAVDMN